MHSVAQFEEELDAADGLVLLEYYQPNCRSCRALSPKLDQLARTRPELRVFNVNTVSAGGKAFVAKVERPQALPFVSLYRHGERVWGGVVTAKAWSEVLNAIA